MLIPRHERDFEAEALGVEGQHVEAWLARSGLPVAHHAVAQAEDSAHLQLADFGSRAGGAQGWQERAGVAVLVVVRHGPGAILPPVVPGPA